MTARDKIIMALSDGYRRNAGELAEIVGASVSDVQDHLIAMQDDETLFMRNGLYWLQKHVSNGMTRPGGVCHDL